MSFFSARTVMAEIIEAEATGSKAIEGLDFLFTSMLIHKS
jgi:hypothetical protein